ncbi:hypothetical protein [Sedimenticola sp.]|uniref:hypothetical protein n=1 Tax=Sedimenticola sp. TaxID=1940285 RepID=UPI003D12EE9E
MSINARDLMTSLFALAMMAASYSFAVPPDHAGGGRGGGGKPHNPDLYGDLVIIDRDINGVPITTLGLGPKDKWVQVPQPVMLGPVVGCPLVFTELEQVGVDSIYTVHGIDARYVPMVDGEIPTEYLACTTEADFGRLSAVRAPEMVVDHALEEMVTVLSGVDQQDEYISVDEAGRLVVVVYTFDDDLGFPVLTSKTIDAPMENGAAFERILEAARLYHDDVIGGLPIALPVHPGGHGEAGNLFDRAAAMLGAAADKSGKVGLDETLYTTQFMTLTADMTSEAETMFGPPFEGTYFNFSSYEYDRSITYSGNVCYLKIISPEGLPPVGETLPVDVVAELVNEPLLPLAFPPLEGSSDYVGGLSDEGDYTGFTGSNVWAFAQAADDARAVIEWMHSHPVPIELEPYCQLAQ